MVGLKLHTFGWAGVLVFALSAVLSAQQQSVAVRLGDSTLGNVHALNDSASNDSDSSADSDGDAAEDEDDLDSLLDSDVSELRSTQVAPSLQMEVSTVSRQKSTIGKSPAAVYVVTQEMIRRSGARSVPEVLRLVPGLNVAKIGSSRWSVSSRGFIGVYNAQLLVQVDGRSIYTPIFGGVVWSWHDMLLADIERIEVIRGPGSTVWGANAVNGVINIITKSAKDTPGVLLQGGGGTEERSFAGFQVGGTSQRGVHWRLSGKWFDRDAGFEPNGLEFDSWSQAALNLRMDWENGCGDKYTLQAGGFSGELGSAFQGAFLPLTQTQRTDAGGNVLFRWTRPHSEESDSTLQVWADHYNSGSQNDLVNGYQTTADIDFQHRRPVGDRHSVIVGAGYRTVWDNLASGPALPLVSFQPPQRTANIASVFIQDEIELRPEKLFFTIGTKLSHNTYTGVEVQPSARLLWAIDDRTVAWTSFSRAVRVPGRDSQDIVLAVAPGVSIIGNRAAEAEPLLAYEFGYRRQPTKWFSWDATVFYHDYNDLLALTPISASTLMSQNLQDVRSYGAEVAWQVDMNQCWKIRSWYSYMDLEHRHFLPLSSPTVSPRHQVFMMSTYNMNACTDVDFLCRYVDDIRSQNIGSYIQADLRLAWRPRKNLEVSVVGQNLLDSNHLEFVGSPFVPEIGTMPQRGVYGMLEYRY